MSSLIYSSMTGRLLTMILMLPLAFQSAAQEPELKLTPSGRILIDGALYASPHKKDFPDGMAIPEVRLGAKARYGKWNAAIDVSYAYSKIGLRNMWIEYGFDPGNSIRIGNFIHQFGLQSTSSSMKCTMEQPVASALFTPGLQLGAMYVHHDKTLYAAASAHVESSALKEVMNAPLFNRQGYALLTRIVVRPHTGSDLFWHIGISGGFASPQRNVKDNIDEHDAFTNSANFPTKVVQRKAVGVTVDKARNLFKFTPEVVFSYGRAAFEGQYFFQQINRKDRLRAFRAQSGYATVRGMLIGKGYGYSSSTAQIATPAPGSLECVLNYNYADLSDRRTGISGGRCNTLSATLNYYINPYITARLNYFHSHTWDSDTSAPMTLNGFQARLMLLF